MHKLFTVCTEQVRSPYTEHGASGLPNATHLKGEVRFDQAQDQQVVTTRGPRIVTECLLTRSISHIQNRTLGEQYCFKEFWLTYFDSNFISVSLRLTFRQTKSICCSQVNFFINCYAQMPLCADRLNTVFVYCDRDAFISRCHMLRANYECMCFTIMNSHIIIDAPCIEVTVVMKSHSNLLWPHWCLFCPTTYG